MLREITRELQEVIEGKDEKIKVLKRDNDKLKAYTRRANLLVFGVNNNEIEDVKRIVIDLVDKYLKNQITPYMIDSVHLVGKCKQNNKGRPIIVKFVNYKTRHFIFLNKRNFKQARISVQDLTGPRLN